MQGKYMPMTSVASGLLQQIAQDVYSYTVQIVNIAIIDLHDGFVLIDAGMPESGTTIISTIKDQFGEDRKPIAIILTHGHFDHIGGLEELLNHWDVPVYAHKLELPFLTGQINYPEPDGTVEGGLVAKLSPTFPHNGINLKGKVEALPDDGTIPVLQEWRYVHTPGHSPGHISLFRESDRTLIAGDAFVTVKQDSLYKVLVQKQELHGPPRYLTTDWQAAWDSVKELATLKPEVAITGHGLPMAGEELKTGLGKLAQNFGETEIPDYGKYV
ncbi:MBL fold metallo-hydrolase [Bacillus kwashiorkori]|uniref:MBL fold metallo-hydrolase n=1 Tax=Bacillus kwashiorkori TaxID=1522318 RepID=UPI000782D65F|nr:MBL fold metallo-hydrolase [Bacillus kwashiorkori]